MAKKIDHALILRAGIVIAVATLGGAAFAQNLTAAQQTALRKACATDMRTVCAGIQPGGGRLLQCIQANPDKISQPCKETIAATMATAQQ